METLWEQHNKKLPTENRIDLSFDPKQNNEHVTFDSDEHLEHCIFDFTGYPCKLLINQSFCV